jgi:hypothetical protein
VEPAWISISRKGGSEPKPCADVMDAPRFLAGIMFRYRHNVICRSFGTLLRERVYFGDPGVCGESESNSMHSVLNIRVRRLNRTHSGVCRQRLLIYDSDTETEYSCPDQREGVRRSFRRSARHTHNPCVVRPATNARGVNQCKQAGGSLSASGVAAFVDPRAGREELATQKNGACSKAH